MTSLESVVLARAAEQMASIEDRPSARRVVCACGCNRWAYVPPRRGRLPLFLTPECWLKERRRRRALGIVTRPTATSARRAS